MFLKLFTIFILSFLFQCLKSSSQILNFTYNGFRPLTDLSIQGIASVTPKGLMILTNTTAETSGHAFYTRPIRFKVSQNGTVSSFSTTFVFAIHSQIRTVSSHGLVFVIAPTPSLPYGTPSYIGLFNITNNGDDRNHIFAVELDTIRSADFNETDNNHAGIDINSLFSVDSSPAGYWDEKRQFKNLSLISRKPMQVWVDYDGRSQQINVTMAPFKEDKPRKPLVSTVRDLSSVILQDMFVGFSASTGSVMSEHYLLGWSFGLNVDAPLLDLKGLPKLPRFEPKKMSHVYKIGLISLFLFFSLIFLVLFVVWRKRKFAEELEDWEKELKKNRFRFKDLYYATKGFKEKGLLGSGGFGSVYKGVMPGTKLEIAVKRVSHESRQGLKEFVSEIVSIGHMSHRNIVPLLGYCRRRGELLLVYDYMPNGSLDKYLYNAPKVTLNWKQRIKVITGIASGLFYLHEEWEQVVIHRDVKASNVLLDGEFNGRLGDFGLSRLYDHGSDPQTTHIVGTLGYLAPEHIRTGRATTATDAFAFGMLLLEVACGRRPIEIKNKGEEPFLLVDWVSELCNKGNILDAKDPNMGSEYDQNEVEMVLKLGLLCAHSDPQARPSMRQVLHYLRGDATLADFSTLDLSRSGMIFGVNELGTSYSSSVYTGGSSINNSLLSSGR